MNQQMTTSETADYNLIIERWGYKTRQLLKSRVASLAMKGKGELVKQIQMKTKKDFGEIDRVIYNFPRHGAFLHKGVGRGYIMIGSTVVRGRRMNKSRDKNTAENSVIRPASGPLNRHPKDWFNPVFAITVPQLADMIAKTRADNIFEKSNLKIRS